jgi:hypothetical protein
VFLLPLTFGVELNESANYAVGRNQIVQLAHTTSFGLRKDKTLLASVIIANDDLPNNHLIKELYFFDLVSERRFTGLTVPELPFEDNSAVILCEREQTHDLYAFQFHAETLLLNRQEAVELSIYRFYRENEANIGIEKVADKVLIKAPVMHQNFISGISGVIYDYASDSFAIPYLSHVLPSVADKALVASTIGLQYDPATGFIDEITRDGTNLIKVLHNANSLPLDKDRLTDQVQYDITSLMPSYESQGEYLSVNPVAETMVRYSPSELFGKSTKRFFNAPFDSWAEDQKILYTLFTHKDTPFEVAPHVTPDRDIGLQEVGNAFIRGVLIDADDPLMDLVKTSPHFPVPESGSSLFLILKCDYALGLFSVLHAEISGASGKPYAVSSAMLDGIIWFFIDYHNEDTSFNPVISFDMGTESVGHHGFTRVSGEEYPVETDRELPRLVVNTEQKIIYVLVVSRSGTDHGFSGVIYNFFNINYQSHITDASLSLATAIYNTYIPQGVSYYKALTVPVNGYVLDGRLFIDVFNGQEGEVSYTFNFKLFQNGVTDETSKVIRLYNDYYRSIPLKDSAFVKTYKNGVIQDITGYRVRYEGDIKVIEPIIAIDSEDVLIHSTYAKTRTFILLNKRCAEVPEALASIEVNDKAFIILPNQEELRYLESDSAGFVSAVLVKGHNTAKYTNFMKSGFLPVPKAITPHKIVKTKSNPLPGSSLLAALTTDGQNSLFFYTFDITHRIFHTSSAFRFINQNTEILTNGDVIVEENRLYVIGSLEVQNNYLSVIEFDFSSGLLLSITTVADSAIGGIKAFYNKKDRKIYILGGKLSNGMPNTLIYAYDTRAIPRKGSVVLQSPFLEGEVTDVYYNEELNKSFIQLKTTGPSSGSLIVLNHEDNALTRSLNQDNPIATERLIQTKGKALAYLNNDLALHDKAHYVFDPVTFNYIEAAGNEVLGPDLHTVPLCEVVPLEDKSVFTGISVSPPKEGGIVYEADFTTMDGWIAHGMTGSYESEKLKGVITESLDAEKIYFSRNTFGEEIKYCEMRIEFSGAYDLIDKPAALIYDDDSEERLTAVLMGSNKYRFFIPRHYTKAIKEMRIYPSFSVVPGRVLYINSIEIIKTIHYVAPDLQWAIGPAFFANASPSPLGDFATKRLFTHEGNLYLYGKEGQHEIHLYDKASLSFVLYDSSLSVPPGISDARYLSAKVYLDGTVRFCFATPSINPEEVIFSFVLYNITGKKVIDSFSVTVPLPANAANYINTPSLSIKPLWVSHYFVCLLTSSNLQTSYVIKIDLSTATGASYGTGIPAKASLEWFYDRIIALGGYTPNGVSNADNALDYAYKMNSFRITGNDIPATTAGFVLPVTHDAAQKRSSFIQVKSGKKVSSLFTNALALSGSQREALIHYDDASLDIHMASLSSAGGNGEENGTGYTPYIEKQFTPRDFAHEIQLASFEASGYLSDERIRPYAIPYKDNMVLAGFYDKLDYPSHNSPIKNYEKATSLRVAHLSSDLIGIYDAANYLVYVYSGVTSDTVQTRQKGTKALIKSVNYERNYGSVITGAECYDRNKLLLFSDNSPAISTAIIHEDGDITVKRYDGAIFGRSIDPGTNSHTIQEVDLTFLFDSESSEYEMRKEQA